MVFLTLRAEQNGQTFSLDSPIKNVSKVRLLSCTIPSSWFNTNGSEGIAFYYDTPTSLSKRSTFFFKGFLQPGHYTTETFANALRKRVGLKIDPKIKSEPIEIKVNTPSSEIEIKVIDENHFDTYQFFNGFDEI